MRLAGTLLTVLALVCLFTARTQAADKEVTLKGEIMCAKCELKEAKKCQTLIRVKEDGKEVTYYFLDRGNKEEHHEAVCGGGKKAGTVTGTVTEKDGKKWVTPKKVDCAAFPSWNAVAYPTYTPTIITSPWAKLMSLRTP